MATAGNGKLILVLLGRTGSGKSATGNSILGCKQFKSKISSSSTTRNTDWGKCTNGREIVVIDTPGVFDTRKDVSNAETAMEIAKCTSMALSHGKGIDAFVLVLSCERYTDELVLSVELFKKIFGDEMLKYVTIVFTGKDNLDHDNLTLADYLTDVPTHLRELLRQCDNRAIAFNNRTQEENEKKIQRDELIRKISETKKTNGGIPFTNVVTGAIKGELEKDMERTYKGVDPAVAADNQCNSIANESSPVLVSVAEIILNVLTLGIYGWMKRKLTT